MKLKIIFGQHKIQKVMSSFLQLNTLLQLQFIMKSCELMTEKVKFFCVFCLSNARDKNSHRKSKLDRTKGTHIRIRTPESDLSDLNISAIFKLAILSLSSTQKYRLEKKRRYVYLDYSNRQGGHLQDFLPARHPIWWIFCFEAGVLDAQHAALCCGTSSKSSVTLTKPAWVLLHNPNSFGCW